MPGPVLPAPPVDERSNQHRPRTGARGSPRQARGGSSGAVGGHQRHGPSAACLPGSPRHERRLPAWTRPCATPWRGVWSTAGTRSSPGSPGAAWPRSTWRSTSGSDREVALKVMHHHLADDEAFTARFIREARSAARLSHPNVVQVYDQGSDGDLLYLAMEYLPGRTLRDVLVERGVLTPREALTVFEPVLDALSAAHRAGIVHRDVKPENVILTDDGRVKVADFGLARGATPSAADHRAAHGHRRVPVPGAGHPRGRRRPQRRLRRRDHAVRDAHRLPAVHRRRPDPGGLPARPRAGAGAVPPGAPAAGAARRPGPGGRRQRRRPAARQRRGAARPGPAAHAALPVALLDARPRRPSPDGIVPLPVAVSRPARRTANTPGQSPSPTVTSAPGHCPGSLPEASSRLRGDAAGSPGDRGRLRGSGSRRPQERTTRGPPRPRRVQRTPGTAREPLVSSGVGAA